MLLCCCFSILDSSCSNGFCQALEGAQKAFVQKRGQYLYAWIGVGGWHFSLSPFLSAISLTLLPLEIVSRYCPGSHKAFGWIWTESKSPLFDLCTFVYIFDLIFITGLGSSRGEGWRLLCIYRYRNNARILMIFGFLNCLSYLDGIIQVR